MILRRSKRARKAPTRYEPPETEFEDDFDYQFVGNDNVDRDDDASVDISVGEETDEEEEEDDGSSIGSFIVDDETVEYLSDSQHVDDVSNDEGQSDEECGSESSEKTDSGDSDSDEVSEEQSWSNEETDGEVDDVVDE